MNLIGGLPESLTQGLLVGKLLVGGLGVSVTTTIIMIVIILVTMMIIIIMIMKLPIVTMITMITKLAIVGGLGVPLHKGRPCS